MNGSCNLKEPPACGAMSSLVVVRSASVRRFDGYGILIEIGTPVGVLTTEPGTGVHLLVGPFMGDRRLHE